MKNKNIKGIILVVLIVAVFVGIFVWSNWKKNQPGELDTFTSCLKEKGAIFYGTFWCPYCQNQKKMFGNSARLLPYVECSTPDGRNQLQICTDENIEAYPTWVYPDSTRESGEIPLERLAEKTGCVLPVGY